MRPVCPTLTTPASAPPQPGRPGEDCVERKLHGRDADATAAVDL